MSKTNNQKGFSLVEGLLLVIAVSLLIFVGYYVWHSQKETDKTLTNADRTSDIAASSHGQASVPASYLPIKELGVNIPLSSKIQDAVYELAPDDVSVGLSTKAFEDAVGNCMAADTASASFPSLIVINKTDGTYKAGSTTLEQYSSFAAQLPGYYLTIYNPVGREYCNGSNQAKNQTTANLQKELGPLLINAVKAAKQTN